MSTLSIGLALFCLMLLASETSALKCWRCSSDATNLEFCNERLDQSLLTPEQRDWYLVECSPEQPLNEHGERMVSKCRTQIHSFNQQKVYTRSCVVETEHDLPNACLVRSVLPEVTVLGCQTCQHDGCNDFIKERPT